MIEETLHAVEEVAQEKLHDLGERLHLTREPNREEEVGKKKETEEKIEAETRRHGDAEKKKSVGG